MKYDKHEREGQRRLLAAKYDFAMRQRRNAETALDALREIERGARLEEQAADAALIRHDTETAMLEQMGAEQGAKA
jgi:hypothetical protein